MNKAKWIKLGKYLFSGGSAFVLDFALLVVLVQFVHLNAGISAAIAFIISTIYAYLAQKYITFSAKGDFGGSIFRYLILLGFNTLFTSLTVELFQNLWQLYYVGKIVAAALTTAWNLPIMHYWVYRSGRDPQKY